MPPPPAAHHRFLSIHHRLGASTRWLPGYLDLRPLRARQTPLPTLSSGGPWLRQRFCCLPASSLTMATSELLPTTVGLSLIMPAALRWTEGNHFYLPELDDVPSSLFRWFQGALTNPPLGLAFANTEEARQPYVFRTPDCVRGCNETATFALCYGPPSCWPRSGRDFYYRACLRWIAPSESRL
jgi:hypothetical protein